MEPLLLVVERLEALVAEAGHLPLTNRLLLDGDRLFELLDELRRTIPPAVEEAERIVRERDRILREAREKADEIVREARQYGEQLTRESSITQRAEENAARIEAEAKALAREIREAARRYADDVLAKVEANLDRARDVVRDGRTQLRAAPREAEELQAGPAKGPEGGRDEVPVRPAARPARPGGEKPGA